MRTARFGHAHAVNDDLDVPRTGDSVNPFVRIARMDKDFFLFFVSSYNNRFVVLVLLSLMDFTDIIFLIVCFFVIIFFVC